MEALLPLAGLYNWDTSIFDEIELPEGVILAQLTEALLLECGTFSVTLPDPAIFKRCVKTWSIRRSGAWTRALAAMTAEYNPIHNYDRSEQVSDIENTDAFTSNSTSGTSTGSAAAFNSSAFENKDKVVSSQTGQGSASQGRAFQHSARLSGNIGVTTSQAMVEAELDLADKLDIYSYIVADFKKEFCLLIY